jgi:hypothetical protein
MQLPKSFAAIRLFMSLGIGAFLIGFCPMQVRANTSVFDTLGPGNTYNQTSGLQIIGSSAGLREAAAEFAPMTDVNGAWKIDLGLTKIPMTSGGSVDVFLYGNAAGSPDNTDQTLLGSVTPTQFFGTTNNSLVSLTVGGVPLVQGKNYWLVLKPAAADTHDIWNDSVTSTFCCFAASADDSHWAVSSPGSFTEAFRITTVPDSGSTLMLLMTALAAIGGIARRRLHSETT